MVRIQSGAIVVTIAKHMMMAASGVPKDPNYNSVSLLLPMTAGNGSTTFTDYSKYATSITSNGSIAQSSGQYKFPPSSGYFNSTSNYLTLSNTNFAFGTGDWTIECWLYHNSSAQSFATFFDNGGQGMFFSYGSPASNLLLYGAPQFSTSGFAHGMTNATWNFITAVRNGSTVTLYVNGSSIGSYTGITGSFSPISGATAYIGRYSAGGYSPNTYIQDLRITNGLARYTANFTPPTELFPRS